MRGFQGPVNQYFFLICCAQELVIIISPPSCFVNDLRSSSYLNQLTEVVKFTCILFAKRVLSTYYQCYVFMSTCSPDKYCQILLQPPNLHLLEVWWHLDLHALRRMERQSPISGRLCRAELVESFRQGFTCVLWIHVSPNITEYSPVIHLFIFSKLQ